MIETPFVERRFELDGVQLIVRFFTPSKAPGGEFQCRYAIGWLEREVRRYACGEDGLQALMLALRTLLRAMLIRPGGLLGVIRLILILRPLGALGRYTIRRHSHKPFQPA
ncbi:DUF6968 family protein [Haematobacter genomosp. 1]|uniref:DUF6968 domain-containing protein n=1 Tax=Haematobacter genomosp. 1 TaxID=366618 RepID=A0A212A6S9_9RHOB|nr:hypothetical protein [Haematobacter genomosp. 1]OWJ74810.1 hypothetical protein CDV49_18650 [Haematobacter genomosp. 1]